MINSFNIYLNDNSLGTTKLAQDSIDSMVKFFIFLSSSKAYGENSLNPFKEDATCAPLTSYDKSKLNAEEALRLLSKNSLTKFLIFALH